MISIGVYHKHKLMLDFLVHYLNGFSDLQIVFTVKEKDQLFDKLKTTSLNILIINLQEITTQNLNLIVQLNLKYPQTKILILSSVNHQEMVLKTIKAGAKGFVTIDSGADDLAEAIYTLRNGHDYYSKHITHLLLNQYISNINEIGIDHGGLSNLSARQIEILRLWGESHTNQEIADQLFISIRTVETHKNHIMQKLNLRTTIDLVKFAIKNNIISI